MSKNESLADRVSIAYLLAVTTSVALAFAILRLISHLNFKIETAFFPQRTHAVSISTTDYLIATLYGVCLATAIFAIRSKDFWKSPGKIIAVLFASMCILNWGLDILAASIVCNRLPVGEEPRSVEYGYIFGFWYRNIAPAFGYVIGFLIILQMNFRVQPRHVFWRLVWIGFLFFDIAMIAWLYDILKLPAPWYQWYLEVAIGIPIVSILVSLLIDWLIGNKNDWWTIVISGLLIFVWVAGVLVKLLLLLGR